MKQPIGRSETISEAERRRVESVVETLATLRSNGESLAEIAHDARNMVTTLGLYCDLLEEPHVLAPAFAHYGGELRLVAAASRRLVEKLVQLDNRAAGQASFAGGDASATGSWPATVLGSRAIGRNLNSDVICSTPVADLAAELMATRNLLDALSGPAIALTVRTEGGALPARITGEDLTRVLVNLVKNAVQAMPSGGHVEINLRERVEKQRIGDPEAQVPEAGENNARWLILTVEDDGPGIPPDSLEKIFESGYSVHAPATGPDDGLWTATRRGLGLGISRSIVQAAGGRMYAKNKAAGGARIVMELPVEANCSPARRIAN